MKTFARSKLGLWRFLSRFVPATKFDMEEVRKMLTDMHAAVKEYHDKIVSIFGTVGTDLTTLKTGVAELNRELKEALGNSDLDADDKAAFDDLLAQAQALDDQAKGITVPTPPAPPNIPAVPTPPNNLPAS